MKPTTTPAPLCPACGSGNIRIRGPLAAMTAGMFGGQMLGHAIKPGRLAECLDCRLQFRDPLPSQEELANLYAVLPPTVWEGKGDRHQWRLARETILATAPGQTVLDVGCFNGEFLDTFPAAFQKLGIEPCLEARQAASTKGIRIIGRLDADALGFQEPVHAITAFDVLEHVTDPVAFFNNLRAPLAPGGILCIATGATDSFHFRVLGANHYYCTLPEHMTFYCAPWFEWIAPRTGFKLERIIRYGHETWDLKQWVLQILRAHAYGLSRQLRPHAWGRAIMAATPGLRRARHWDFPPRCMIAKDHLLAIFRAV